MLRRVLPCLLLALGLAAQQPSPPTSQPAKKPPAAMRDRLTEKELARLRERARYWTDAALEEEGQLDPQERPILYARLGGLWWNADRNRARRYMEQAFDAIERMPK